MPSTTRADVHKNNDEVLLYRVGGIMNMGHYGTNEK